MNTSKYKFQKVFQNSGADFSASHQAEKWLFERGYGIGTMCATEPRAIQKGATYLPKWKHFNAQERASLDGIAMSKNWREGEVIVYLLSDPDSK